MNKKLTHFTLLLACFLVAHKNLRAQGGPVELITNPKDIFQSTIDKPINYYSGSATITVPISNDVPVALSYTTTGIKPEQASGTVGLGWELQGGGEIRRIQRGLPDESTNRQTGDQGRFKPYPRIIDPYVFSFLNTIPQNNSSINTYFNQANPSLISSENYDLAPDEFLYNVAGHSGRFYFTQSGTVLTNDNITVEVRYQADNKQSPFVGNTGAIQITRFILTFNDGVKYYFDNIDEFQIGNAMPVYDPNHEYYSECGAVTTVFGNDIDHANSYADNWKITKIVYPFDNLPLVFEYEKSANVDALRHGKDILYYYYINQSARTGYHDNSEGGVLNACASAINKSRLKSISKGRYRVEFAYITDASVTNTYRNFTLEWISEIRVIGLDGEPLKKYVLTHNRTSARRHLLTQIDILPGNGQGFPKLGKYKFEYDMTNMPDFEYLPGMLGNTAPVIQPITNTCGVDMYGYFNGETSSYKSLISIDASRAAASSVNSPIQQSRTPNANKVQALSLKKVTYPFGGSIQYTYEPNTYSYASATNTNTIKVGGGIRVKEVRISDGIDTGKDVVKQLEYVAIADNSLSSGVIENEPLFEYRYISPASATRPEFWLDMFSPESWLPTGIGYEQVIEKSSDGGKTIYQFTTSKDYPHEEVTDTYPGIGKYVVQYAVYTANGDRLSSGNSPDYRFTHKANHYFNYTEGRYDYMRGLLKAKLLYDASNRPVSSNSYTYISNEIGVIPTILMTRLTGYRGKYIFTNKTNVPNNNPSQYLAYDVYHDRLPAYMGMLNITNVVVGKPLLSRTTSRTYDLSDPTKFYETVLTNTYNRYYNRISSTKTTDSQGREVIEEFKCTSDYLTSTDNSSLNALTAKNILNKPVESVRRINGKIVSGTLYDYDTNGLLLNSYSLKINQSSPVVLQPTISNFKANINNYFKEAEYVYSATTKKLLTEIKPGNSIKSTLWTYGQFPCAAIEGTDLAETRSVEPLISATTTINPGTSAFPIYSVTNPQNSEVQFHIKITKANSNKCSEFLTLTFTKDGKPFYSEHFNSDSRCAAENDVTLNFDLPAGYYLISATMPPDPGNSGSLSTSPISVQIDPAQSIIRRKAFYTSFEELTDNSGIIYEGKTGNKSFNYSYILPLPTQAGTYKVSYWEAVYANNKLVSDWVYKEEVFSIPATTQKTIGDYNHPVDEVRIQPVNTLMTSSSLDKSFQLSAQNTPGNKIIHYEYDTFGRIMTVYDDNKNVIKSYDYHIKN